MSYSFFDFLQLIGALGIFIFGMKIFSDGLQKFAGSKLRSILKGMTKNRFSGLVTGFAATTITQSSTTTTVLVVSFVNAGLITFIESTGVIMGANIGTTVTAWMVSIFGFQMKITPIAISMIGLFFPFLFFGREKLRNMAEAMIGFGILFIGLEFIKDAVPNIQDNPEMFAALDALTGYGFGSIILFVFIGTILTLLTQSSSAAMAITLVMLFQGWITFPIAAAMILGENIGTTVTANIAAIVGNVHAKRAARFHFVFNVIGVLWMMLLITPFLNGIDAVMGYFNPEAGSIYGDTQEARAAATLGLSLFHTTFNVMNVILLFGFVPAIIRFVEKFQKDGDADQAFRLQYISGGLMSSPELSIAQAHKEIELFGKLIEKMHYSFSGLFFKKKKNQQKFLKKIRDREQITDNIELEVSDYLTKISSSNLSQSATKKIRSMHSIINDLERVGDLYYQLSKTFEDMMELDVALPKDAVMEVSNFLDMILEAIKLMRKNMQYTNGQSINLEEAVAMENKINEIREQMKEAHYKRLEKGIYTSQAGVIFLDYITRLEKIGDHIFNVQESLAGRKLKTHSDLASGR